MRNQEENILEEKTKKKKYRDGSVKVFGFRSGKSWKMIPAILYYLFAAIVIVLSVGGEFTNYKFEGFDYILIILKYIFITIFLYSPVIFLSDFEYTKKIPLFKKKTVSASIIGMLIVLTFCYFMVQVNIYCCSPKYKASVKKYTIEQNIELIVASRNNINDDTITGKVQQVAGAKEYVVEVSTDKSFKEETIVDQFTVNRIQFTHKSEKYIGKKELFVRAKVRATVDDQMVEGKWSSIAKVAVNENTSSNAQKIETTNNSTKKAKK